MVNNSTNGFEIRKAIVLTLAYTDQFDFPLTSEEIYLRLIWRDHLNPPSAFYFNQELDLLADEGFLGHSGGYYFLKGSSSLPAIRVRRQKYANLQREEIKPLLVFLRKIPWVRGVVVTGSLALNAISSKDDSDFLLVIMPNRIWLTRVLVIFYAWLKGKRRSWRYEEENSWCFNLWLDSDHLSLPGDQRSVYTAYEVCQADWVWWRHETAVKFYLQNSWVKNTLPFYWKNKRDKYYGANTLEAGWINPFSIFLDILDYLAYLLQLLYMRPHRTREKVSRSSAFFHPRDTKSMVGKGWRKSLENLLGAYES